MSNRPTEESFLKDVASHEMHVLMDSGVYRHIRFKRPGSGCMYFDLITYPGYLVYSGDMGCYVFSRIEDMFAFFRTDPRDWNFNRQGGLSINLGYWSEKLQAVDGNRREAGATEFDEETFNRVIIGDLVAWIREHRDQTTKDQRRELWDSVVSEVIEADSDGGGYRKTAAAYDFSEYVNDVVGSFHFQDLWERNFNRYTYRFVWCCYALAWGVRTYDEKRKVDAGGTVPHHDHPPARDCDCQVCTAYFKDKPIGCDFAAGNGEVATS